jgi:hypothetical protein
MSSAGSLGSFWVGHDEGTYPAFWPERNRGKALRRAGLVLAIHGRLFHEGRPDSGS